MQVYEKIVLIVEHRICLGSSCSGEQKPLSEVRGASEAFLCLPHQL